jgi:hypothetical protein
MTNREWLAGMTNEELAAFIDGAGSGWMGECWFCYQDRSNCDFDCTPSIQKWLEAEHEEE